MISSRELIALMIKLFCCEFLVDEENGFTISISAGTTTTTMKTPTESGGRSKFGNSWGAISHQSAR